MSKLCKLFIYVFSNFLCPSFLQVVTPESTRQHRLLAKFETVLDAENSFCCVLSEVDGLTSSSVAFPLGLSLEGVFCLIFYQRSTFWVNLVRKCKCENVILMWPSSRSLQAVEIQIPQMVPPWSTKLLVLFLSDSDSSCSLTCLEFKPIVISVPDRDETMSKRLDIVPSVMRVSVFIKSSLEFLPPDHTVDTFLQVIQYIFKFSIVPQRKT